MAQGIMSLGADIDYIFSGESELSFVSFLQNVDSGTLPSERIVHSSPNYRLDDIAVPSFQSFYDQLQTTFPDFDSPKRHGCRTKAVEDAGGVKSIIARFAD